jgi:hypothetical protein
MPSWAHEAGTGKCGTREAAARKSTTGKAPAAKASTGKAPVKAAARGCVIGKELSEQQSGDSQDERPSHRNLRRVMTPWMSPCAKSTETRRLPALGHNPRLSAVVPRGFAQDCSERRHGLFSATCSNRRRSERPDRRR